MAVVIIGIVDIKSAFADLVAVDDNALAAVTGQALLVSDQIAASSISGAPAVDSGLTFYRMGLDAQLDFNANINKLQLGCGGVNDFLTPGICDIDLNYVRFMGNNGSSGPGNPVTSDFGLTRPYVELAVSGDGTANREVVGIGIGAQTANGYLGIGRTYSNGQTNQETGQTCTGGNDVNCQSGMNSLSGFVNLSLTGSVSGNVTCLGLPCGTYNSAITNQPATINGSRVQSAVITVNGAPVTACFIVIVCVTLMPTLQLTEPLQYLHGISLNNTPNFDLSFQRQQVAYPTFDKTGFNATANTGWWMNLPSNIALTGINATKDITFTAAASGAVGFTVPISNLNLGQVAPKNCFGNAQFC